MTECPECIRAEAARWERIAGWLLDRAFPPNPTLQAISAAGGAWRAMLGTPEPTWYEKHRDRWIETGDVAELERMTRHVVRP